jgi:hypothetical protein
MLGSTAYVTALGRKWHAGCLVCGHCRRSVTNEASRSQNPKNPFPELLMLVVLPWHVGLAPQQPGCLLSNVMVKRALLLRQASFAVSPDGRTPYHPACHRQCFDPKCCVCRSLVPRMVCSPTALFTFSCSYLCPLPQAFACMP